METASGSPESKVPLQSMSSVGASGHLESVGEPEPPRKCRKCDDYKKGSLVLTVTFAVVTLGLLITVIAQAVLFMCFSTAVGPACPDGWVGYRGKCYYFSEADGNWTYSQSRCSSLSASLAEIDTLQDLDFMLRYKGRFDHWIGLRRDPGQPWKWASGTEFNNLFQITGDGDCAYLTDGNGVSSLRCTSERHWICSKSDAFTEAKEAALQRG